MRCAGVGAGCDTTVNLQRVHHALKRLSFLRLRLATPIEGETLPTMAAPDVNTVVVAVTKYLHLPDPCVLVTFVH